VNADSSRIAVAWSKIATVWSGGVAALLPPWSRDANLPADDSSDDSSVHGGAGHGDRGLRTVELSGEAPQLMNDRWLHHPPCIVRCLSMSHPTPLVQCET
jgi:hypothetical protein